MAWIDYKKAFDSFPQSWILEVMSIYKLPSDIRIFIENSMSNWKTRMCLYHDKDKCATIEIRKETVMLNDGVDVRPETHIRGVDVEETYRYLGMEEVGGIQQQMMKEQIQKEYNNRIRSILKTHLYAKNEVIAINSPAIPFTGLITDDNTKNNNDDNATSNSSKNQKQNNNNINNNDYNNNNNNNNANDNLPCTSHSKLTNNNYTYKTPTSQITRQQHTRTTANGKNRRSIDETEPDTPLTTTNNTNITSNSNPATPMVDLNFSSFMDKDDDDLLFEFDMNSIINSITSHSTDINRHSTHTQTIQQHHYKPNNKRTKNAIGRKQLGSNVCQLTLACSNKTAQFSSNINVLNKVTCAFFVGLMKNLGPITEHADVIFDKIITNEDDIYDKYSGRVTAPVPGIYQFHVIISAQGKHKLKIEIQWHLDS
ncbi:hypothetical protein HELRODRAFT_175937 [Helobdella robusta]|uniref:C1q domain-containing protein n=1 Tax=Helobdella robusta TaxID=6412 RepID=T1F9X7_HELRO|nr:hypothetical protein HELRODRAFT_175937 [Helobdella robusta]ESO00499.1 hypothetical protein HELRODRAFT_175937 [Helobdella robusta]